MVRKYKSRHSLLQLQNAKDTGEMLQVPRQNNKNNMCFTEIGELTLTLLDRLVARDCFG